MNRNPVVPFILIMVLGIGLIFLLSFKGLGDMKEVASEKEGGGKEKTEEAAKPEDLYTEKGCIGCHGDQLQGLTAPKLADVGARLSKDELKDVLLNGKGTGMPGGLVTGADADAVAEWLSKKK